MAQVGSVSTSALAEILRSDNGLAASLAQLELPEQLELGSITAEQILSQNVANELAERGSGIKYPVVYVYCERIRNLQTEKFRRFSGKAHMVMEVRVSQDRLENLERTLQAYVDAVTNVLERSLGEWSEGMCYGGGYEVAFGGIKHGGKNYLQVAKVTLELNVSLR